ncbi:hypothetical protein EGI22_14480 [Lacihabitans sp. LS3-19]|uniref:hypothetical protein n=1 Tax=Lacihabitans sp. LS3-19 TaxID=2487335 RepID=UPI0020CEDDB0|nr:hypothetical protein [Lacihabitans sp. LS3-19]MCP9769122.1 hypothetical protein [Lacihabitans sp. LS3-19]
MKEKAVNLFEKAKNENAIIQLIKWLEQSNYDKEKLKEKAVNLFEKAKNENDIIQLIKWLEQSNYDKEKLKEKAVNLFEKTKNKQIIGELLIFLERNNYDNAKLVVMIENEIPKNKSKNFLVRALNFLTKYDLLLAKKYACELQGISNDFELNTKTFIKLLCNRDGICETKLDEFLRTKKVNKNKLSQFKTAIQVLGNTQKVNEVFNLLYSDEGWQNSELTRFLTFATLANIDGWNRLIKNIYMNPQKYKGRIIGNALIHRQLFPEKTIQNTCFIILNEWKCFFENAIESESQYTGHVVCAMGHPNLRRLASKTAYEILESNNLFLISEKGSYLYQFCKDIVENDIFPIWDSNKI